LTPSKTNKSDMKATFPLLFASLLAFASTSRAQVETFKPADLVLGAPDLDTVGTQSNNATGINNPNGVAIDPATQKVFVTATVQHRILRYASSAMLSNGAPAEAVLGQTDFAGATPGTSSSKFNFPGAITIDSKGRLWVADPTNNRVLMFENAATIPSGSSADLVLGQPDFTSSAFGTSASQMRGVTGAFVDSNDNVWVTDSDNNRVLKFESASTLSNGAAASVVLGQAGFGTAALGTSNVGMRFPIDVMVDSEDNLWVLDANNNRVLRFQNASSLGSGAAADGVLGQSSMTQGGSGLAADRMYTPHGLLVDPNGTLWVNDYRNNRVLCFTNAPEKADGAPADFVLGQSDFVTNTTGTSAQRLNEPSQGIARDNDGNLWVTDRSNHRVVRYPGVAEDENLPELTILNRPPKSTKKAKLPFFGTAGDPGGLKGVFYRVGKGAFRPAAGTTSWRFKAPLRKNKKNVVQIQAEDLGGNKSPLRTFRISRR
jgi:DNA-binding beta-propeller fold protein YncE